jgi:hypothetical protein
MYRVSPEKVRNWIVKGELEAVNTADSRLGKPRLVITAAMLERFEARRRAATAPKPTPRKRRRQAQMIDFFPD